MDDRGKLLPPPPVKRKRKGGGVGSELSATVNRERLRKGYYRVARVVTTSRGLCFFVLSFFFLARLSLSMITSGPNFCTGRARKQPLNHVLRHPDCSRRDASVCACVTVLSGRFSLPAECTPFLSKDVCGDILSPFLTHSLTHCFICFSLRIAWYASSPSLPRYRTHVDK